MAQRASGNGAIVGTFVLAGVLCAAMAIAGFATEREGLLASGLLGLAVLAVGVGVVLAVGRSGRAAPPPRAPAPPRIDLDPVLTILEQIQHNLLLSDGARRVLFLDREIQMIRDAVNSDIAHGDYAAAEVLCDRVESILEMPEVAAELRSRIHQSHQSRLDSAFYEALDPLTERLEARDWAGAHTEAGRLKQRFPEAASQIDQQIHHARQQHKHVLQSQFNDAARVHDVERAMNLLHELDRFLSPDEAAALSQTAQQVVAEHRENLGRQFKRAVSDKRWADAARHGELIIKSYPNSKMSAEVRGMIEMVRTRATEAALAAGDGAD